MSIRATPTLSGARCPAEAGSRQRSGGRGDASTRGAWRRRDDRLQEVSSQHRKRARSRRHPVAILSDGTAARQHLGGPPVVRTRPRPVPRHGGVAHGGAEPGKAENATVRRAGRVCYTVMPSKTVAWCARKICSPNSTAVARSRSQASRGSSESSPVSAASVVVQQSCDSPASTHCLQW